MDLKHEREILENFGKRLKELRTIKDLSQEALAYKCEIDRSYVGQVERGERNVSLLNIAKLALGLNVAMHELLLPLGNKLSAK